MSCCTFLRTQLKVRGKSQHSGRGFYDFEVCDLSYDELEQRVKNILPKWEKAGIVESSVFSSRQAYEGSPHQTRYLEIQFREGKFGKTTIPKYYRGFFAKEGYPWGKKIIGIVYM